MAPTHMILSEPAGPRRPKPSPSKSDGFKQNLCAYGYISFCFAREFYYFNSASTIPIVAPTCQSPSPDVTPIDPSPRPPPCIADYGVVESLAFPSRSRTHEAEIRGAAIVERLHPVRCFFCDVYSQ